MENLNKVIKRENLTEPVQKELNPVQIMNIIVDLDAIALNTLFAIISEANIDLTDSNSPLVQKIKEISNPQTELLSSLIPEKNNEGV